MAARSSAGAQPKEHELVLTRVSAAPPALVFRAWSRPEHFARWFGPKDVTLPFCELDARPGGVLHFHVPGDHRRTERST